MRCPTVHVYSFNDGSACETRITVGIQEPMFVIQQSSTCQAFFVWVRVGTAYLEMKMTKV